MNQMMEIAARYANGEEEVRLHNGKGRASVPNPGNNNSSRKQKHKADGTTQAKAATLARQAKNKGKAKEKWIQKKKRDQSGQDVLDQPCHIHTKRDEEGNLILPKHTTWQCRLLIQQFKEGPSDDKNPDDVDSKDKDDAFPSVNATLVIFADVESKNRLKVIN